MAECRADFETRSDVDLKQRGAGPYFASPHWRALILAYSIDDGPIHTWTGGPCPVDLRAHIESGGYIKAFNASFERHCFDEMARRHGWPRPAFDRYRCSMATASALGLPHSLDKLGEALGLQVRKDKRGAALIRMFSIPAKHEPLTFREPEDHPKEFAEFISYCRQDVETEAEADRRMVPLSDDEQAVYTLSETINQRGVRIDVASARAALRLIDKEKARLDAEMSAITGGYVTACTQASKLSQWLMLQGVFLDGVAKDDILEAFELDDLPDLARKALTLRQEAAKPSTVKLKTILAHIDADDRVRGTFVYHGTGPGRWCLAEGSPVLVKTPFDEITEKPIEDVDWCDQVWDGDSWVRHDGVVFSGVKHVISHCGVTATPEHIVYIDDTSYCSLGEARQRGLEIYGRTPSDVHDLCSDVAVGKTIRGDDKAIDRKKMESAYQKKSTIE